MCLIVTNKKVRFKTGFKVFWKNFIVSWQTLRGVYQPFYYNVGWNHPSQLTVDKRVKETSSGDCYEEIFGGVFHAWRRREIDSYPIVALESDVVAVGEHDIALSKIFICPFTYEEAVAKNSSSKTKVVLNYFEKVHSQKIHSQMFFEETYEKHD